ncbi:hypothetical protein [Nocardioides panacihumi]
MTTESKQTIPATSMRVLLSAASWSAAVAVAAVIVAALVGGADAAVGALIGGVATLAVLAIGTWVVLKVATVSPMASLIAALVVFTAQGGLLLLTLATLSGLTDGRQVDGAAIAVIAVTMTWTTLFAVRARRERIPLFDLSAALGDGAAPAQAESQGSTRDPRRAGVK